MLLPGTRFSGTFGSFCHSIDRLDASTKPIDAQIHFDFKHVCVTGGVGDNDVDDFDNNGDDENVFLNKVDSEEVDFIVLVHK